MSASDPEDSAEPAPTAAGGDREEEAGAASPTPPADDWIDAGLSIPRRLGDFRLIREVGRGGMGLVFEAEELSLRRRVALKVLPVVAALDADRLGRFRREAELVARLAHGNIVPIYAIRRDEGIAYFAMPLIEGRNLAELILEFARPRPVGADPTASPPPTAPTTPDDLVALARDPTRVADFGRAVARLGRQAAEALSHSHEAGILHRDVKPANLIVGDNGQLWVTDFGLARLQDDTDLTRAGSLIGTIRYMSPEQSADRRDLIDGRTDIYSLGMTLYETLARRHAFAGIDGQALIDRMAAADPPPLRSVSPAIAVDLEVIVIRATARAPGDRYASAALLADDLHRFAEGRPIRARRPTLVEVWRRRAVRPERVVEAAQALFWFGVLLTGINAATLLGQRLGLIRPPSVGRFYGELAIGFVLFDLPLVWAGVRALRGKRDGLIVGAVATAHLLALLVLAALRTMPLEYGGITAEFGERWLYGLLLGMMAAYTLVRLGLGIAAERAGLAAQGDATRRRS